MVNKHWDSRQPLSLTFVLSYSYEYCTGMYVWKPYRTIILSSRHHTVRSADFAGKSSYSPSSTLSSSDVN